jgi:iron-only hydrogenase group A
MANVDVTINGREVSVEEGSTILEAAQKAGFHIPTLCHLKGLSPTGACRVCVVEVDGARNLVPSCAFPVRDGMVVRTHTPRVLEARTTIVQLLLANHPPECLTCVRNGDCELQSLAESLNIREIPYHGERRRAPVDLSSPSIERDPEKCILCGRCVRVCEEIQGVSAITFVNRGFKAEVAPAFGRELDLTSCTNCGQCIIHCPTGALRERSNVQKVWDFLHDPKMHVVVQTAPAVRVAIGEMFGMPPGTISTGQLASALSILGFDRVFDTNFAADLTIVEEATELVERVKSGGTLPMITSCSPGWVKYVEHYYPDLLDHVSTCRSPHEMLGAMVKSYYADAYGIYPGNIAVVSVMPCTAKKFEAERPELETSGFPTVDAVLTVRELGRMIKLAGLDFANLPPREFDTPLGISSGAADIFGATGGVMEAALRTAAFYITGSELSDIDFRDVRGLRGIKDATVKIGDLEVKVAVASGLSNAKVLMDQIAAGKSPYTFIEIMGCPSGCINGGGMPQGTDQETIRARMRALYMIDQNKVYRRSHQNPAIRALYENFLGEPGGHRSHEYLHTTYMPRERS